jgi:hypothetical protein
MFICEIEKDISKNFHSRIFLPGIPADEQFRSGIG